MKELGQAGLVARMRAVKDGCIMLLVNLGGRNCLGGLTLGTPVILKRIFKKEGIRHLTQSNLFFRQVQKVYKELSISIGRRAIALTPFHSVPLFVTSSLFLPKYVGVFIWVSSLVFWLANPFWGISHPLFAQRAQPILIVLILSLL